MACPTSSITSTLLWLAPLGVVTLAAAGRAEAAAPTYYNNLPAFQADITSSVTDNYGSPGYVFSQNDGAMSAVLGETDYMATGHANVNLVVNAPADPRYCAGCNGSFQLSFQTTSVGNAVGVNGVGLFIEAHDVGSPYFAFITFGDGTTDNIVLPAAGNFWGVAAPERIQSIHFGLSMGVSTTGGYFEMDDLIVGDGNIGTCEIDADCVDDADPCTDPVCNVGTGLCEFVFNTAPCDDGELCTEMDTCNMGVCEGTVMSCDDGNPCTTDFCQLGAGCAIQLNTDPCDDGSVCTDNDTCAAGMCTGTPIDCDDGDVCSMDSCDPVMGCTSEPVTGCCIDDGGCAVDETCDPRTHTCVPLPSGSSSDGGDSGDTGSDGTGSVDSTGADDTGAGDSGSLETGIVDTGILDAGDDGSTGGSTGGADGGQTPSPDPSGCSCTTDPSSPARAWWMVGVLGLVARRRRRTTVEARR